MAEVKLDPSLTESLALVSVDEPNVCENTLSTLAHFVLISLCKMQLCPPDSIESDWYRLKCPGEMLIQLLKINHKIRSLHRAQEIIGVTRDISPVHQPTHHTLQ